MAEIDPNIPKPILEKIFEEQPIQGNWNDELKALMNPSITARLLHVPISGQIKKRLNREYEYRWVFDRCGQTPNHERVEQLRSVGWEYATTTDVEMHVMDTVKGKNEIRSGDRRLMKLPMNRWLEIRKAQLQEAIGQAFPRRDSNESVVMSNASVAGLRSYLSDRTVDEIRASAVLSDAGQELATGVLSGNASKVEIGKGA